MKIVVDDKIPYIDNYLKRISDNVIYMPGKDINAEVVKDADALLIRTRTKCDSSLLEGSKIKFIGTATIGYDHIDTEFCKKNGITWKNCPGCNAGAVEQYVHSALALLEKKKNIRLKEKCIGIVGVGHVGTRIAKIAYKLGMKVLLNDPPREDSGEENFVSLKEIAEECDIISFHTPLTMHGKYKTFHLADELFFNTLRKKPIIINTSRGDVIETNSLINAIKKQLVSDAIIDVWENEPEINRELLKKVFIGTPHIAGYSADGKANATQMTLSSLCDYFGIKMDINISLPPIENEIFSTEENARALQKYNPMDDYNLLIKHPERFEILRSEYKLRRE